MKNFKQDISETTLLQRYVLFLEKEREIALEESLPMEYLHCFRDLWADLGIQLAISKGNEYALHENLRL
jgi:guanine nucleotide-binding protein subunit alpha